MALVHSSAEGGASIPAGATAPVRVKLSRQKGWRMPTNTVKVDRSTRWGNPFVIGYAYPTTADGQPGPYTFIADATAAVRAFRGWIAGETVPPPFDGLSPLRGKNLACWCALNAPCHADVLLDLANAPATTASAVGTKAEGRSAPNPSDTPRIEG